MDKTQQGKEIAILEPQKGQKITVSFDDVVNYLCPNAAPQEVALFLKTCQSENLNPFAHEIYLIKYDRTKPASIVISSDAFLKAAESNDNFDGYEAGIILKDSSGKPEFREGSFLEDEEENKLVGGWARVYRKDRERPFYAAVNIKEYRKYTREGQATRFWNEMPATMIRKVALSHALHEAFPNRFAGTYTTAEVEILPEGELPPAFMKNEEPDWAKFWSKASEMGYTEEQVHHKLGVESVKDWLAQGKTLEEAMDKLEKEVALRAPALEIPTIGEELLQGWQIVKSTVKELGLAENQVSKWFEHYGIKISLADFSKDFPPPQLSNAILSHFQTSLDAYREKLRKA